MLPPKVKDTGAASAPKQSVEALRFMTEGEFMAAHPRLIEHPPWR
ncbi:hypothetical protein CZ774_15085 [Frigoribacterium sp. JB110]|nr:hypothetical protein CZ774_15085 [Frigoribacterium sp. JB110]